MAAQTSLQTSSDDVCQHTTTVNPHFACYWLETCRGKHQTRQCSHWSIELRGKLGIYYSPSGLFKRFSRDKLSGVNLENNVTGCTSVNLLIYTNRTNGEIEILFGLIDRRVKEGENVWRPLLSFPSSKPNRRNECGRPIAERAFDWITSRRDIFAQRYKPGFLYQHGTVIHPLSLTSEQADELTQNFVPNERIISLHWFPLKTILESLPSWKIQITQEATEFELAQYKHVNETEIRLGEYEIWRGNVASLMCIRDFVPDGFTTFLKRR